MMMIILQIYIRLSWARVLNMAGRIEGAERLERSMERTPRHPQDKDRRWAAAAAVAAAGRAVSRRTKVGPAQVVPEEPGPA